MTRRYSWGPTQERVISHAPHVHWKITTFLATLRVTGLTAPLVLDGPMNGETFPAWVQQFLVPTLKRGEIIVMDHLSSDKQAGVVAAIEQAGASTFYLPPTHPIEKIFSKLKTFLRRAQATTRDTLWDAIGSAIQAITPSDCQNCLTACGYHNT